MRNIVILLFSLLTTGYMLAADNIQFTASAPDAVVLGDQFRLTYTITTHKVKDFRAPGIKDFEVLMGPMRSQRSNTEIINGTVKSTNSITFTYTLLATGEGTFDIPGATIVADGKPMTSNSVKVKVLPQDKDAGNNAGGNNRSGNTGSSAASRSTDNSISDQDLFITVTANKVNVYKQEAFLLTYKIYTSVDLCQLENAKLPDFTGFHSQEVEREIKWTLENYRGKNYNTTVYRQFVLFPQQTGELKIEPARFDASVARMVRNVDPFEAFFNGGSNYVMVKKTLTTPALTINVGALPSGKPSGFTGAVGQFNITSSISAQEVKTNDAITLKLVISGVGNLKLLSNPDVKFPDDFEVYDPKVETNSVLTQDGLSGNRTIEYLVIPRHAGEYKIPAVSFSYFDTKAKEYKTLTTEEYTIRVNKGEGNSEQVIANFTNKENLRALGEDIRFIKLNHVKPEPRDTFFVGTLSYYLWYVIPTLLFVAFVIGYRKRASENANVVKVKTKKANKIALKRLKLAAKLLSEDKKDAFYDEALRAQWGYIGDKLNIPVSELNKDNVQQELQKAGVSEELIGEFITTLNECEFARYAPGDQHQAMDKVYQAAVSVISNM
ncbi:MAG: BatD family protein [Bacteroides sp.]|nr:BatD family protein [Bacteroides sp.]